jgi:cytochrome c peroxidase
MDIGTTSVSPEKALSAKAPPPLPLFRITCDASAMPHPLLGRVFFTYDPGRGLITGKCADVGSIVPQQLRALAARAPYFSNGSAQTLREVIDYYDRCFDIGYTEQEKQDLTNFLRVL